MTKHCIAITVVVIVVLLLVMIVALIATSLRKLDSNQVGIKYDIYRKKLYDEVKEGGLYSGPPGFHFVKFPKIFKTFDFTDIKCLNRDGVPVKLHVTYQYRPRHADLRGIIEEFRDFDSYQSMLKAIGESSIHDVCSKFNTTEFQSSRDNFQKSILNKMTERYDVIRSDVADLQVNDIRRPPEYDEMIQQKAAAREDIKVAGYERPKKLTEANTKKKETEKEAEAILQKADSDVRIANDKSEKEARSVKNALMREADTYIRIMDTLQLNPEQFLVYMGVRNVEATKRTVNIAIKPPAITDYSGVQ